MFDKPHKLANSEDFQVIILTLFQYIGLIRLKMRLSALDTSSPKKSMKRTQLNRSLNTVDVTKSDKNITLNEYSSDFSDYEVRNLNSMSPVKVADAEFSNSDSKVGEEKVTSFDEHHHHHHHHKDSNHGKNEDESSNEDVKNDTIVSNNSEAETTIQRVKEFIESKRKRLDNKSTPKLSSKNSKTRSISSTTNQERNKRTISNEHQRNLRKMVYKIQKLPYKTEWSISEWTLFHRYLVEWKTSCDDSMFQPLVLQELFNCSIEEIQMRINSLKKFTHWKRRVGSV